MVSIDGDADGRGGGGAISNKGKETRDAMQDKLSSIPQAKGAFAYASHPHECLIFSSLHRV